MITDKTFSHRKQPYATVLLAIIAVNELECNYRAVKIATILQYNRHRIVIVFFKQEFLVQTLQTGHFYCRMHRQNVFFISRLRIKKNVVRKMCLRTLVVLQRTIINIIRLQRLYLTFFILKWFCTALTDKRKTIIVNRFSSEQNLQNLGKCTLDPFPILCLIMYHTTTVLVSIFMNDSFLVI